MYFILSLPNAKICFNFPSNIVIWDWRSPSSAVPPHALALETRRKKEKDDGGHMVISISDLAFLDDFQQRIAGNEAEEHFSCFEKSFFKAGGSY